MPMIYYAIYLHARPIVLLDSTGGKRLGGAFAWRAVSAENMSSAQDLARLSFLEDPLFAEEAWNDDDTPIRFEFEEVRELTSRSAFEATRTPIVFYYDDEDAVPLGAQDDAGPVKT